jgi:hypothetical protein
LPANDGQPQSLAPTHDLLSGWLDQLGGRGIAALEGGKRKARVWCHAATGCLGDRRDLLDQRRDYARFM